MVYFYKTKKFFDALKDEHTILDTVNRKIEDFSKRNSLVQTKRTLRLYDKSNLIWVLKNSGQLFYRVIIQGIKKEIHGRDNHELYIIRDAIPLKLYEPYWRRRLEKDIEKQEYLNYFPLSKNDLNNALKKFYDHVDIKVKEKPDLPTHMRDWLYSFSVDQRFDIYESQNWQKREYGLEGFYPELFKIIKSAYLENDSLYNKEIIFSGDRDLVKIEDDGVTVIYESIRNEDFKIGFLHGWFNKESKDKDLLIEKAKRYPNFKNKISSELTREEITKGAYRGYPATIFNQSNNQKGRASWEKIQLNSAKSNLALAPEQEHLLTNCKFPQFINGQAGSGKSEMLLYIFAELCFQKVFLALDDKDIDIVFLTENEDLLERSKLDTYEKLQNNSFYQDYAGDLPDLKELDKYFHQFVKFVLHLLPIEIQKDFLAYEFINFAKFKKIYANSKIEKNIKDKYPAEIAWYVIMTLIRGYSSDFEELTPDDFERLLTRKESAYTYVDKADYRKIYDRIWIGFYKKLLETDNKWDRLSVVKKVLSLYDDIPSDKKYDMIVCDEAQDFTRIELELLVKLSKYGDYKLLDSDDQIPILFAGDPFQTVNPTGFNLIQVKQIMYEIIEKTYNAKIDRDNFINDLLNNYRSTPEVVNTSNIIQYIRREFLDRKELESPQKYMNHESQDIPLLIETKSTEFNSFKEKFDNCIYIIPCNYGEEDNFKKNDEFLRNSDTVCKSASLAKGSEYPEVVVYKFGDFFCEEFGNDFFDRLLNFSTTYQDLDSGTKFKLNFFFNQLYVAISRTQEKLYLLDTKNGIKNFWEQVEASKRIIEIEDKAWQQINVSNFFRISNVTLVGDIDPRALLQAAHRDMDDGIISQNTRLLEDAIINFKKYKKRKQTDQEKYISKCKAFKSKFEEDYLQAFDLFQKCTAEENFDPERESSDCLWLGEHYSKLINYHRDLVSRKPLFKQRTGIARIISTDLFDIQLILNEGKFLERIVLEDEYKHISSKEDVFYKQLIGKIRANMSDYVGKYSEIARVLSGFKNTIPDFNMLIAELYFEDKDFEKAWKYWGLAEYTDHRKYWRCGAENNSRGDRSQEIYFLNKLGDNRKIIENFDNRKYSKNIGEYSFEVLVDILLENVENYMNRLIQFVDDKIGLWKILFEKVLESNFLIQKKFNEECFDLYLREISSNESRFPAKHFIKYLLNMTELLDKDKRIKKEISKVNKENRDNEISKIEILLKQNPYWGKTLKMLIGILIKSKIQRNIFSNNELNMIRNMYIYSTIKSKKDIRLSYHIAFIDKYIGKMSDRMRIYCLIENFMLRDDALSKVERKFIEKRFWKARFNHSSRKSIQEQEENLALAYKSFPSAKLNRQRPTIDEIKSLPDSFSVVEINDLLYAIGEYTKSTTKLDHEATAKFLMSEDKDRISKINVRLEEISIENNNIKNTGAKAGDIVGGPIKGKNLNKAIKGARFLLLSDSKKGQPGNMIAYFKIIDPGRGTAEDILMEYMEREKLSVKELLQDDRLSEMANLFYTNKIKKLT